MPFSVSCRSNCTSWGRKNETSLGLQSSRHLIMYSNADGSLDIGNAIRHIASSRLMGVQSFKNPIAKRFFSDWGATAKYLTASGSCCKSESLACSITNLCKVRCTVLTPRNLEPRFRANFRDIDHAVNTVLSQPPIGLYLCPVDSEIGLDQSLNLSRSSERQNIDKLVT